MFTTAQPTTGTQTVYAIDPAHSLVEFSVKHMMFTTVKGRFADVSGRIAADEQNPANSSVEVTIDAASVDTRQEQRDAHLRSADFFDTETYPTITFRSTRVEPTGSDELKVYGDLTIHGVTREVALDTTFNGRGVNPWGAQVVGYSAATQINRKDFGLTYNAALETGGVLVGDTVKIALEIEATPPTGDSARE
ncbi:MAG: YceI family protein [Thermomicrobiales bacterium]